MPIVCPDSQPWLVVCVIAVDERDEAARDEHGARAASKRVHPQVAALVEEHRRQTIGRRCRPGC